MLYAWARQLSSEFFERFQPLLAGESECNPVGVDHHEGPSAVKPQPKLGISRAKAKRPQRPENNGETFSKIIHLFPPNLACFAPWRESIPCSRIFQIPESLRQPRKLSSNTKRCGRNQNRKQTFHHEGREEHEGRNCNAIISEAFVRFVVKNCRNTGLTEDQWR